MSLCFDAYPNLPLVSDPNNFSQETHASLTDPAFDKGPLADSCTTHCTNGIPDGFQWVGQRRECCSSPMAYPGHLLATRVNVPVDNLSGYYTGYARNARYVGKFGGVVLS